MRAGVVKKIKQSDTLQKAWEGINGVTFGKIPERGLSGKVLFGLRPELSCLQDIAYGDFSEMD